MKKRSIGFLDCLIYISLLEALKKANITCKLNAEKHYAKEHAALLEGGEEALRKRKLRYVIILHKFQEIDSFRTRRDIIQITESVTASLYRSSARMNLEADRAAEILRELGENSFILNSTASVKSSETIDH